MALRIAGNIAGQRLAQHGGHSLGSFVFLILLRNHQHAHGDQGLHQGVLHNVGGIQKKRRLIGLSLAVQLFRTVVVQIFDLGLKHARDHNGRVDNVCFGRSCRRNNERGQQTDRQKNGTEFLFHEIRSFPHLL